MASRDALLGAVVRWNNDRVARREGDLPNPRDLTGVPWNDALVAAHPTIAREWTTFEATGGRLPLIEDLIDEHQGNEGPWRAGLLVSRGRPCHPLARRFPATMAALGAVPSLRSALWSVLEPGTRLHEHAGPNGGVLRYHLGVSCGEGAALRVGPTEIPYRDGVGILFDDTAPHAAWNAGSSRRVTLFCEIDRSPGGWSTISNRSVQALLGLDPRFRRAPRRAAEWYVALDRRGGDPASHK